MTQTSDFNEIIKLRLKKPKNWNWQLTTSKSSPHIALPAIHLYNSKGKLLLKTSDSGDLRNSWSSCNLNASDKNSLPKHLQRCRSDNLQNHRNKTTGQGSINGSSRRPSKGRLSRSSANLLENKPAAVRETADAGNENERSCENIINATRRLRKSRSDVLDGKHNPGRRMFQESFQRSFMQPPQSEALHRRSNSDELYRKSLKYRDESLKRAITDGYENFLTPHFPEDKPAGNGRRNRKYTKHNTENIALANTAQNADVTQLHHKKYKTRTSSAGTLIISDESFSFGRRRRRRNENGDVDRKKHADVQELLAKIRNRKAQRLHQISDPTGFNKRDSNETRNAPLYVKSKPAESLFYSCSDVFPFAEILEGEKLPDCDGNSNYIVQEPITPSSESKSRKNSGPIVEPSEVKRRVKLQRKLSIDSTSSDALERITRRKRGGTKNKGKEPFV